MYQSQIQSQYLSLSAALQQTSYRNKNQVGQILQSTFQSHPRSKILLITRINPYNVSSTETIFLIHHIMPVPYSGRTFDVELLIYLPFEFPLRCPEFYFFKKPMLSVAAMYLVNPTTRRDLLIDIRKFTTWNRTSPNLPQCLDSLHSAFVNTFPCFKSVNKKDIYSGACEYNVNNVRRVSLAAMNSQVSVPQYTSNASRFVVVPEKKIMVEREMKDILIKEIMAKVKGNLESNMNEIFCHKNALTQLKTKVQMKTRQLGAGTTTPQNKLLAMQSLLDKYAIEENKLINQVEEARRLKEEERPVGLDSIESIVEVKTPNMLKYFTMENTLLEYFLTLKKACTKKACDFPTLVRQYRLLSIELFNIQYLQKKQLNQNLFGAY